MAWAVKQGWPVRAALEMSAENEQLAACALYQAGLTVSLASAAEYVSSQCGFIAILNNLSDMAESSLRKCW